MLKKGELFNIILTSSNHYPEEKEPVSLEYAFHVPHWKLTRTEYNRLAEIIKKDFPWITDEDLWTKMPDLCPGYSFEVPYEEFERILKKYGIELKKN